MQLMKEVQDNSKRDVEEVESNGATKEDIRNLNHRARGIKNHIKCARADTVIIIAAIVRLDDYPLEHKQVGQSLMACKGAIIDECMIG